MIYEHLKDYFGIFGILTFLVFSYSPIIKNG